MATDYLVNNTYPVDYWLLDNVSKIKANQNFWSSKQRFASIDPANPHQYMQGGTQTAEYLELDYGRIRTINYQSFNVLRAPLNITIEYDTASLDTGQHFWKEVTGISGMPFNDRIHYTANVKNPFYLAEFYFTDDKNNPINTRYLRIKFARRDVNWPTNNTKPFRWPVCVKDYRSAKYISEPKDAVGLLYTTPAGLAQSTLPPDPVNTNETQEIRQRFTMPDDAGRGNIDPKFMGFGFLASIDNDVDAEWHWSLYDIRDLVNPIRFGSETQAPNTAESWIDIYFDQSDLIQTDRNNPVVYELRIKSANAAASDTIILSNPAALPGIQVVGNFAFTQGSSAVQVDRNVTSTFSVGDYVQKTNRFDPPYKISTISWDGVHTNIVLTIPFVGTTETVTAFKALPVSTFDTGTTEFVDDFSQSISLRLWADVASSGQDVLGNSYRHGSRYSAANHIVDDSKAGWISAPNPSPEGVEALYFDVRNQGIDTINTVIIDSIRIAPRTPGIRMHVYYTDQNLNSVNSDGSLRAPKSNTEWDQMLWTPINITYILRSNQTFLLPTPIRASYVKLEFSRLQPLPFKLPHAPALPPVAYKRYPTWIENQFDNATIRRVVQDWFIQNKTPVMVNILKHISDPVLEFQYKEREFLAALSLNKKSLKPASLDGLVNTKNNSLIDPVTGSKIFFQTNSMYQGTLVATVNSDSLLGKVVGDRLDPSIQGDPIEGQTNFSNQDIPAVSSTSNRISESFSHLAMTPMWFNRKCRHVYKIERGTYNQKAYFAGISSVEFLRKDYTIAADDPVIVDNIEDLANIEENTFVLNEGSQLAIAINNQAVTGIPVTVFLSYVIGDPVTYTDEAITFVDKSTLIPLTGRGDPATNLVMRSGLGGTGIQYTLGVDYDLVYTTDPVTGELINNIVIYSLQNQFSVKPPSKFIDQSSVLGRAVISSIQSYKPPLSPIVVESNVATAVAVVTGSDTAQFQDIQTVTAVAVPTGTTANGYTDSGVITSIAAASGTDTYTPAGNFNFTDSGTVTGVASVTTATESRATTDTNTVTSVASVTGSDTAIFSEQTTFNVLSSGGVAVRQGVVGSDFVDTINGTQYATYPNAHYMTTWVQWDSIQPSGPSNFNWNSILNTTGGSTVTLDQSIDHAAANGYQIIFRVSCGADAPTWLYNPAIAIDPISHVAKPCVEMRMIGTQGTTKAISYPLFWDANLQYWYDQLIAKISTQLSGSTSNGNRRADFIYFMAVSMPTEQGTEMSIGYGHAGSYLPAPATPTTANTAFINSATFGATTADGATLPITLPGGAGAYPSGDVLLKVDGELIFASNASGVFTLKTSGRGFSGTTAVAHLQNALVTYIDSTQAGYFKDTTGYLGAANGLYDIQAYNQGKWLAQQGLSANRASTQAAWNSAIDIHINRLDPIGVPTSIAIGPFWSDHYQGAINVVTAKSAQYGEKLWVMPTNLQPGRDTTTNNPTKVFGGVTQSTYYGGFTSYAADTMNAALTGGAIIGFQLADISLYNLFTNPFSGPTSALQVVLEESLVIWQPTFVEMAQDILATNNPPNSGTITTEAYLIG